MTALIDTSALIGLTNPDDPWQGWAQEQFDRLKDLGPIILLDIVYAETCAGMADQHEMDTALLHLGLQRYRGNDQALFRASRAMLLQRERRAKDKSATLDIVAKRVLPDMIIGAVAEFEGIPLLTANAGDFASYFPTVRLITPPSQPNKSKQGGEHRA